MENTNTKTLTWNDRNWIVDFTSVRNGKTEKESFPVLADDEGEATYWATKRIAEGNFNEPNITRVVNKTNYNREDACTGEGVQVEEKQDDRFECGECGYKCYPSPEDVRAEVSMTKNNDIIVVITCENCGEEHFKYAEFDEFEREVA